MGCCNPNQRNIPENVLINRALRAIERSDMKTVKLLSQKFCELRKIDDEIGEIKNVKLNALGYALWTGQIQPFIYFHRVLGARTKAMEELFAKSEITSLHIICAKGYIDILKYYLPFYVEEVTEYPEIQEFVTSMSSQIYFDDISSLCFNSPHYLPIQLATIQENISLLAYVYSYFSDKSFIPRLLDMEYKEESTGENCVLVACRNGNYKMIVFFYKNCKLNFRVKNNLGHNAINVLIDGSKSTKDKRYYNCLRYLVEKVCVDVEYMYPFNLKVAQDPDIIKYLECKLREYGITATKKDIDFQQIRLLSYENERRGKYMQENSINYRDNYFLSQLEISQNESVNSPIKGNN